MSGEADGLGTAARGHPRPDTPRGRPEHERRGPGYQGRRDGGGPRPAGDRPAVPAGPGAGVSTARMAGKDEVEDLRQQLERLQLTMQQVMGVDTNYYTTQQEIPGWGQGDPETASEMEEVGVCVQRCSGGLQEAGL